MADTIADNGSASGLNEPSYDVQVTLADLQDTDNPLATAKDFKDLNLSVDIVWFHRRTRLRSRLSLTSVSRLILTVAQCSAHLRWPARHELQEAVQSPGEGLAPLALQPSSQYDCPVPIWYWKDRSVRHCRLVARRLHQATTASSSHSCPHPRAGPSDPGCRQVYWTVHPRAHSRGCHSRWRRSRDWN